MRLVANGPHPGRTLKNYPTMGSRFISTFCFAWRVCSPTLKASHKTAQGKRSGVAAKRHPGLRSEDRVSTLKGLHRALWTPFRVPLFGASSPRAALRLPWAILSNRFAVGPAERDRNEKPVIVQASFPSLGAGFSRVRPNPLPSCRCGTRGTGHSVRLHPTTLSPRHPRPCFDIRLLHSWF
jgi:hypothetical protein